MMNPPDIEFFQLHDGAPPFVPAPHERDWMDQTAGRHAYRCTPLTVANSSGWELRCPFAFEATWDGSAGLDAIQIRTSATPEAITNLIASHFGHGILTFHTGWLIKTSAGWGTWARGTPNWPKHGITALDGLIETEWLPFPFTMNWKFTAPGNVAFDKGEPFCFIMIVPHFAWDAITPITRSLSEDPILFQKYSDWRDSRSAFNIKLQELDETAVRDGWQKEYARGKQAIEQKAFHTNRRRLNPPGRTGA